MTLTGVAPEDLEPDATIAASAPADLPASPPGPPLRSLLITEGTYPYAWGGVSTWCDSLVHILPEVSFHVLAIVPEAGLPLVYNPPQNVEVRTVPFWGLRDIKETWRRVPIRRLHRDRVAASNDVLAVAILPAIGGFLREIMAEKADPDVLAECAHAIYRLLGRYDLHSLMREQAVWEVYRGAMIRGYQSIGSTRRVPPLKMWELTTGYQWLARWLFPLVERLPETDVVHPAMAGVSGLTAVVAKLEHGAGLLLTEHGVYLRERYLDEAGRTDSLFLKLLSSRFARATTEVTYAFADQISPCCDYNQRWELKVGARKSQLETIYYGVDSKRFVAQDPEGDPTTVVWVGRINPLKDVETLLRAAALVARERPDARFKLFGSATAEEADYHSRCLRLHEELLLHDVVEFCGFTDNPAAAFASGDIVTLSSISEGFPYSTLEAMLCGRPIVATAVGGIPEQIDGAGIAVPPRDPAALAEAILSLMNDPERCRALGVAAKQRAARLFNLENFRSVQLSSYLRLSPNHGSEERLSTSSGAGHGAADLTTDVAVHTVDLDDVQTHALQELAVEVEKRVAHPLDVLEVAAVLESMGLSDRAARQKFGYADTFGVAAGVLGVMRTMPSKAPDLWDRQVEPILDPTRPESHLDTARHPGLALLPSISLLLALWALSSFGGWHPNRVLALSVGMSTGILCTSGLALGAARRASNLISLGKCRAARRLIATATLIAALAALGLTQAVLLVYGRDAPFLVQQEPVFVASAVGLSIIWMLGSALSLVRRAGLTGVAVSIAVACGAIANFALGPLTSQHLLIAAGIAFAVAVVLVTAGLAQSLRPQPSLPATNVRLPSLAYVVLEALPYFAYGTLGAVVFASIHVVGWVELHGGPQITTLELGLILPLVPAALAAGRAERTLRRFWSTATALQRNTPAERPGLWSARLRLLCFRELVGYVRSLAIGSVITVVVVEVLLASGAIRKFAPGANVGDVRLVYLSALFGYAALSIGYFYCTFCLSLVRYRGPLRAMAAASLMTVVLSYLLARTLGFQFIPLALVASGAVYTVVSYFAYRRLFDNIDYCYATAL